MTVAEFLLSTDRAALAARYAADALPGFYAWEEHKALLPEEATDRLQKAAAQVLGELMAEGKDPKKTVLTQEFSDEEDPEDIPWFTAVITEEALAPIADGAEIRLPADAIILGRRHYPEALSYTLGNRCKDTVGQAAALLAVLCCPGFPQEQK